MTDRRYLLNYLHTQYLLLFQDERRRERLMKKLGIRELPQKVENREDPSDIWYEEYFVLREQVAREPPYVRKERSVFRKLVKHTEN